MLCQQKQSRIGNGLTQTGAYWRFVFVGTPNHDPLSLRAREGGPNWASPLRVSPYKASHSLLQAPALAVDEQLNALREIFAQPSTFKALTSAQAARKRASNASGVSSHSRVSNAGSSGSYNMLVPLLSAFASLLRGSCRRIRRRILTM